MPQTPEDPTRPGDSSGSEIPPLPGETQTLPVDVIPAVSHPAGALPAGAFPAEALPVPAGEGAPPAGSAGLSADTPAPLPGITPVSPVFALIFLMTALSTGSWHMGILVFATGMLLALRRKLGVSLGILFFLSLFPVGLGIMMLLEGFLLPGTTIHGLLSSGRVSFSFSSRELAYLLIVFYAVLAGLAYAFLLWAASRLIEEKNRRLASFDYFWLGLVAAGAGLRFLM